MKILVICHDFPSPDTPVAISLKTFNLIKILSEKYQNNISVITFKFGNLVEEKLQCCDNLITINLEESLQKRYINYIRNYLAGLVRGEISLKKRNILDFSFSWKMKNEIDNLIKKEQFDLVFVDNFNMVPYASDLDLPKILLHIDNMPEVFNELLEIEQNYFKKLIIYLQYRTAINYEKDYEKFDACIVATENVKKILESKLSNLDVKIIPFGIDVSSEYFEIEEEFPSIVFFGTLSSVFNQQSVFKLYQNIYPLIKEQMPQIRFYIIGKNPSKEILELDKDTSVTVKGYVKDLKPYLLKASVITLPIHGHGIKTRLLEAMAIGKPVVISSVGIRGIDVTNGKNIIIADDSSEFAARVIELLNNKELREKIGINAKNLMEKNYSWEKMGESLNQLCNEILIKKF